MYDWNRALNKMQMRCEASLIGIDADKINLRVPRKGVVYPMKIANILFLIIGAIVFFSQIARAASPPEEQLDCEVYETEKYGVTAGFSVGNLLLSAGPEVTVSYEQGIAWDKVVQGLIARYVEVCTRYNAGMVTKEQYANRVEEIESIYREAQEYERLMIAETRDRANDAFAELDRSFSAPRRERRPLKSTKDSVAQGLTNLTSRIDDLDETFSQPLTPTTPCGPPDMLGSLGARC